LPEDPATLKALLLAALAERDREQQRANEQAARAAQQGREQLPGRARSHDPPQPSAPTSNDPIGAGAWLPTIAQTS